jgi:hypothetical protein
MSHPSGHPDRLRSGSQARAGLGVPLPRSAARKRPAGAWLVGAGPGADGERRASGTRQVKRLPSNGHVVTIGGMVAVAGTKPLLLERDAELARLDALLEQAHAGSGSVVTITGGRGCAQLVSAARKLAAS